MVEARGTVRSKHVGGPPWEFTGKLIIYKRMKSLRGFIKLR